MTLGRSIAIARQQRGLTQHELATLACVHVQTIRFYEQGRRVGCGSIMRILSDILGVDLWPVYRAEQVKLRRKR
jgi:transcriptional regulator with XRE-family HTH domain